MARCSYCGKEVALPFRCSYCGKLFCIEHHLPEKHNCEGLIRGVPYVRRPVTIEKEYIPKRVVRRPSVINIRALEFTQREVKHLIIAVLAICLVYLSIWYFDLIYALYAIISICIAFISHELLHKFTAIKLGHRAYFRLSRLGLIITLLSAIPLLPIKFIGPGYVAIIPSYYRRLSSKDIVMIAAAGPLINIVISAIALSLLLFTNYYCIILLILAKINADIALFNLLSLIHI